LPMRLPKSRDANPLPVGVRLADEIAAHHANAFLVGRRVHFVRGKDIL
jgi:hypothetical protein